MPPRSPQPRGWRIPAAGLAAVLAALMFSPLQVVSGQTGGPSSDIQAAAQRYSLNIVNDPAGMARVRQIVERILNVADRRGTPMPEIAIISGPPNAQAADGHFMFVSQSLLSLLPDDDGLAIILGHEMAHLVLGHTTGPEYETLVANRARNLGFRGSTVALGDEATRKLERQADQYGLLYAALAGYEISGAEKTYDAVLTDDTDPTHPTKEERVKRFHERLKDIEASVDAFDVGVDYAMRGGFGYTYAANIYEKLLEDGYTSHVVYHNLATAYHLLALTREKVPEICSLSLELQSSFEPRTSQRWGTRGGIATRGIEDRQHQLFLRDLQKAIDNYKLALKMNPEFVPALNNLGCALLERKEDTPDIVDGGSSLEHAAKLEPNNAIVANNLGIFYLAQNPPVPAKAAEQFRAALQLDPNFAPAEFNLGLVLGGQGPATSNPDARKAFQSYLQTAEKRGSADEFHLTVARQRLGMSEPEAPAEAEAAPPPSAPALPAQPGTNVGQLPKDLPAATTSELLESYIELWRYPGWELLVMEATRVIDQVTVESAKLRTAAGVGIGSSLDEVRKAYGNAEAEQARGESRILLYAHRGLLFRVHKNQVVSWSAFKPV